MRRMLHTALVLAGAALITAAASGSEPLRLASSAAFSAADGPSVLFRHVLDDAPFELSYRPEQAITPAVRQFHRTGENPYRGDAAAIARGKEIYTEYCRGCHLDDGTGRIGPSLVDDSWNYPRTGTDLGKFEIIYAGGAGAMQAFGQRMDQDEILKVMAYLEVLGKR